ncbi:MAG: hypothetical protein HY582_05065 [Candidatus Omnitrophica bacterium]|nr:hypothetical protein [Candidatus Omnitrophota bacterium]
MASKKRKWILGVGFDETQGHRRITKGDNFFLYGGSQGTHEVMREKVIKLNEQLKKKGTDLDGVSFEQFEAIAHRVGLYRVKPGRRKL